MATVLQQSPNGVAFEVAIKKPAATHIMTPARARLERYAAGATPMPRLLGASGRPRESDSPRTPPKAVAEKARAQNERKQAVLEKKRREDGERLASLRQSLEEELAKAEQQRRSSLAGTSLKAGEHFGKVKAKLSEVQQQIADAAALHQRKLEEMLDRKGAAHDACIAERGEKAGKHNEQVAKQLAQHQKQQADAAAEQQRKIVEDLVQKRVPHNAGVVERGEKAGKHNEQVAKQLAQHQKQQADAAAEQQRKIAEDLVQKGVAHNAGIAERGGKAGKHNEQVAKQLAQHQKQHADAAAEQQRKIAEDLVQKGVAHNAGVAERGEKAGKHNEQVAKQLAQHQKQHADAAAQQQRKIAEDLVQKGVAHDAGVAERGEKAGKHNEYVADKLHQHQQDLLQRAGKLREHIREKLEREKPQRRALFSGFSPPVSSSGEIVGKAIAE